MEKSILKTVRKFCTKSVENDYWDSELMMIMNGHFLSLNQNGIGPEEGFEVTSENDKWEDFVDEEPLLSPVKTYICQATLLEFDPPSNSSHLNALQESVARNEWRLRHAQEFDLSEE